MTMMKKHDGNSIELGHAITKALRNASTDKAQRHWAVVAVLNRDTKGIHHYAVVSLNTAFKHPPQMMHGYATPGGGHYREGLRYAPLGK